MRISDWSSDVCSSDLGESEPTDGPGNRFHCRFGGRGDLPGHALHYGVGVYRTKGRRGGDYAAAGNDGHWRSALVRGDRHCCGPAGGRRSRSEEHTSELQSLMRISYSVFCLKKLITTSKCIRLKKS